MIAGCGPWSVILKPGKSGKRQASSFKRRAIRSNKLQASSVKRVIVSVYKVCLYVGPVVHDQRIANQFALTVERGALIKFYGARSEGFNQDKIPNCSCRVEHDLMGRETWFTLRNDLEFNHEKTTKIIISQQIWQTMTGPRFQSCPLNIGCIFLHLLPKSRLWFHRKCSI